MKWHLRARDFRNLQVDIELEAVPIVLVGPNATGKTSFLEALYYLGHGRSFRTRNWRALIRWSSEQARIELERRREGDRIAAVVGTRRTFLYQGHPIRLAQWSSNFPVLYMGERTWELFPLAPVWRRRLLDQSLQLLHPDYPKIRLQYYRAWQSRNRVLRRHPVDRVQLESWTERFLQAAVQVWRERKDFLAQLAPRWSQIWREMFPNTQVRLEYRLGGGPPSGTVAGAAMEAVQEWAQRVQDEEVARGTSLIGPHRDDIVVRTDHGLFWDEASAGQVRSFLMAWALALRDLIRDRREVQMVLLLDDFDAELDLARVQRLRRRMGDSPVFVTTSREEVARLVTGAQVLHIRDGRIQ